MESKNFSSKTRRKKNRDRESMEIVLTNRVHYYNLNFKDVSTTSSHLKESGGDETVELYGL